MAKLAVFLLLATAVLKRAVNNNNNNNHNPYHYHYQQLLFVSSFSPPLRHQKVIVSILEHLRADVNANATSSLLPYGFKVVAQCSAQTIIATNNDEKATHGVDRNSYNKEKDSECSLNIVDVLLKWNPNGVFPSKSQVRRSLQLGKVLMFNTTTHGTTDISNTEEGAMVNKKTQYKKNTEHIEDILISLENLQPHIGNITSDVEPHTVVVLVEPIPSLDRYPLSVTKYMFPPIDTIGSVPIMYEDAHLAVVNKPENMTTIGGRSTNGSNGIGVAATRTNDLQSVLGFLLRPSPLDPTYHPRPVHRLDRRTSGLVLIAKTQSSMRRLSRAFATRVISKTYSALVFERQPDLSAQLSSGVCGQEKKWLVVDYPIENREAISEIRRVTTPSSSSPSSLLTKVSSEKYDDACDNSIDGKINNCNDVVFFLVEVRPKTGRTHQIRRHLSYCLGIPIVGDSKYDGGARQLRKNGMYLCCHSLRFPHTSPMPNEVHDDANSTHDNVVQMSADAIVEWIDDDNSGDNDSVHGTSNCSGSQLSIRIPLPNKFRPWAN